MIRSQSGSTADSQDTVRTAWWELLTYRKFHPIASLPSLVVPPHPSPTPYPTPHTPRLTQQIEPTTPKPSRNLPRPRRSSMVTLPRILQGSWAAPLHRPKRKARARAREQAQRQHRPWVAALRARQRPLVLVLPVARV